MSPHRLKVQAAKNLGLGSLDVHGKVVDFGDAGLAEH